LAPVAACADDGAEPDAAQVSASFEEAYAQTDLGKEDSGGCSGVVVPDRSGFGKRVALTFDDGPNAVTTPRVLDVLAEHGVKATFFINGSRVTGPAERAVLARIVAEGHILANHSQSHLDLKNASAAKLASEVGKTDAVLRDAGVTPRFFRFPFGSASCSGMSYVKGLGYTVVGWHIDSADWCFATTGGASCPARTFRYVPDAYRSDLLGYVMSQLRAKDGGVILFHDIHASTAAALDGILSALEDAGYAFVQVDDAVYLPRLNGATPPPARFVGAACEADHDCNFSSAVSSGICHRFTPTDGTPAEEIGFCSLPCEGTCPDRVGASPTFCTTLDGGATGRCVAKSAAVNESCEAIEGTAPAVVARFIGTSSAAAATATACVPR
ncbi:MAG: polysaccharide deacetylase family protein, partial [Myxococcales bacterium]|nr:polysaccharide deacetylase family protein [Myxococcales bacterium]